MNSREQLDSTVKTLIDVTLDGEPTSEDVKTHILYATRKGKLTITVTYTPYFTLPEVQ
jgi:hypothetical protein